MISLRLTWPQKGLRYLFNSQDEKGLFKVLFQDISPRLLNSFRPTDSGEILWFVGTRKRILACILKHEERKVNQIYCNAVISQHVLHLTFLSSSLRPCRRCLPGSAWGRSTCRTGAGRTCHPSPTPACDGCPESPATRASAPTWSEPTWPVSKPTPARPPATASSARNLPVRKNERRRKRAGGGCGWRNSDGHSLFWDQQSSELIVCLSLSLSCCSGSPQSQSARPCKTPCSLRTSCANCTSQAMECMWCSSTQRCVDSSAYVISFPYGQCLEWQTQDCSGKRGEGDRHVPDWSQVCECVFTQIWKVGQNNLFTEGHLPGSHFIVFIFWHKETRLKTKVFSILSNSSELPIIYILSNILNYYLHSGLTVVRYCLDQYLTPLPKFLYFFFSFTYL